jgi:hypothetical protein
MPLKKKRDLVLRWLHRRSTVCPTAKKRKQSNAYSVNVIQGCLPLPLTLILVCQFFFAAASLAGFGVRLYVSIVQVCRRPQLLYQALKSRLRKMGFEPSASLRPFSWWVVESDRDLNFSSISHFHPSVESNLKSQIVQPGTQSEF